MGKGKKNNKGKSKSKKSKISKKKSAEASTLVDDAFSSLLTVATTHDQNYEITTDDLERCLYHALKVVYKEALRRLLDLKYERQHAELALYMNGGVRGLSSNILSNVVENAIRYINTTHMCNLPANFCTDMSSRIDTEIAKMVEDFKLLRTDWNDYNVMFHLVTTDFLGEVSTTMTKQEGLHQDQGNGRTSLSNENGQCCKEFGSSAASKELSDEPEQNLLDKGNGIVKEEPKDDDDDMVDSVDSENSNEWKKKEIQRRNLEIEKESGRQMLSMIRDTSMSLMHSYNHNMILEMLLDEMSGIRADIEAWDLRDSESKNELMEAMKKEKKAKKKAISFEKQFQKLEMDEKNESELETELLQIKMARQEIKVRLAEQLKTRESCQDTVRKEDILQRMTEETTKQKEESLTRQIELEIQRLTDDNRKKEEELSKARAYYDEQEVYELFYKVPEVYKGESCVICRRSRPSYLVLPCGHKILCQICADENILGKWCPDCHVEIKGRIRVFGPT